jgi:uncharacterized membrane protein
MGPVEYIVLGFPGNRFNGDVAPALQELVDAGIINILDLIFIYKDAAGDVVALELTDLPEAVATAFESVDGEIGYLVSDDDMVAAAAALPNNTSAALLVWENVWSERFARAVRDSGGEVFAHERIPYDLVQAAIAYVENQ